MNKVQLAAKLYGCRDTVKRFYGNRYDEVLRPYKGIIEEHQKKFNLGTLESVRDSGFVLYM